MSSRRHRLCQESTCAHTLLYLALTGFPPRDSKQQLLYKHSPQSTVRETVLQTRFPFLSQHPQEKGGQEYKRQVLSQKTQVQRQAVAAQGCAAGQRQSQVQIQVFSSPLVALSTGYCTQAPALSPESVSAVGSSLFGS